MHTSSLSSGRREIWNSTSGYRRDSFVILIRYTTDMFVAHALNMLAPILLLSEHQPIRGVIP